MKASVLYEVRPRPEGGWDVVLPLSRRRDDFRAERVRKITADETPVRLVGGPKVALHFLPDAWEEGELRVDVKQLSAQTTAVKPLGASGWSHRFNADGFLAESSVQDGVASGYFQVFRSGAMESAAGEFFSTSQGGQVQLASLYFENEVIETARRARELAAAISIAGPISVALALTGIHGTGMAVNSSGYWRRNAPAFDRDVLQTPFFSLQEGELDAALRPAFDLVWQAAGWPGSHYYDADGNRTG